MDEIFLRTDSIIGLTTDLVVKIDLISQKLDTSNQLQLLFVSLFFGCLVLYIIYRLIMAFTRF